MQLHRPFKLSNQNTIILKLTNTNRHIIRTTHPPSINIQHLRTLHQRTSTHTIQKALILLTDVDANHSP